MTYRLALLGAAIAVSMLAAHPASASLRITQTAPPNTTAPAAPAAYAPEPFAAGPFLAGQLAGELGDVDAAASAFLRALADDPGSREIAQQAFLTTLLAGRPEAARLAATQGGVAGPGNPAAILVQGDVAAQAGHWDEAIALFATLPQGGPMEVLKPLLTAWAQLGGGQPDVALATLRPLTTQGRLRGVYALHAALIADLSERVPEARRLYAVARAGYPALNLDLARELASFDARDGMPDVARQTLDAVAAPSPELSLALPGLQQAASTRQVRNATDGMAEAYLALAATERAEQHDDLAAILLRLALDMRPNLTPAHLLAAEMQAQAGRTGAALAELAAIPATDPLAAMIDVRRAGLLQEAGRIDEALVVANRLVAEAPDRPETHVLRGGLLRAAKRPREAAEDYQRAIALIGTPGPGNWPLFYDLGIAQDEADRWPAAEASFQRALALSPDQPEVLNYLGYAWTERGMMFPQARAMVERAVAASPDDGAFVDSLGWVELRQGDVADAVKQLERACELESEDATINGHLGDAYRAAGRLREAAFQWQRALTLHPEPKDAAHYEAALKALPSADVPAPIKATTPG